MKNLLLFIAIFIFVGCSNNNSKLENPLTNENGKERAKSDTIGSVISKEHLKFNDIPINGSISEFSNKLVEIGYAINERNPNSVDLSGQFFCIDDCMVTVLGSKKSNIVWKVFVCLPDDTLQNCEEWYSVLKFLLKYKYGKGITIKEGQTFFLMNLVL